MSDKFPSTSSLLVQLLILTAVLLAKGSAPYVNADVIPISIEDYINIEANATLGAPWVVRFLSPYSPTTKTEDSNFREASMMVHRSIAMFGELTIGPSLEDQAFADSLGLRTFPVTRFIHSKMTKATGTKGPSSGRPIPRVIDIPKTLRADAIAQQVLKYSPSRYYHPITYKSIPSVHYIFSFGDLVDLTRSILPSRASYPPEIAFSAPFGRDPIGFLFFFDLMKRDGLSLHAELASLGAKYGPRVVICATEDENIAKRFGLVYRFSGVAFHMNVFADEVTKIPIKIPIIAMVGEATTGPGDNEINESYESVATSGTAASFIKPFALPYENYTSFVRKELMSWHKDILAYASKSPLRKIQHTAEMKEVLDDMTTLTVLFVLRESDQFFPIHFQTAVRFATFIRDPSLFFKHEEQKISDKMNFATAWVDGEIHKDFSSLIGVTQVPSVCIILHMRDEKIAAKFYKIPDDVKKERKSKGQSTDWPTPQDLMKYLISGELLKVTPNIEVFKREEVRFNDAYVDETFSPQKAISNHQYLYVDRKQYYTDTVSENDFTFIEDLADGKIKVNPNQYSDQKSHDEEPTLTPQQKRRAERRKKKLQQELEEKRLAKEERMRKKTKEDTIRRKREAMKTKKKVAKKAKKTDVKKSIGIPIITDDKGPSIDTNRPPKDYIKEKKFWEANTKQMTADYVKYTKDGGVRVVKGIKKEA